MASDSPQLYPASYPPALTPAQEAFLTTTLKEWAISHGLTVRPATSFIAEEHDPTLALATAAPVTLFPSLFPRACFHEAVMIQKAFNELYAKIAMDEEWLGEVVRELIDIDDFIAKLWEIHLTVKKEGYAQDISLGLFRSDYMIHCDPASATPSPSIRQVEFNTIASSFGGLASRVSSLHKYLLQTAAWPAAAASLITSTSLPNNSSIESLARGLAASHAAYGAARSAANTPLCILFIVQAPERNAFDQKHLEYALVAHHRIKVFRLPFAAILSDTALAPSRALLYTPPAFPDRRYEASTLYFRAGYAPAEYAGPSAWEARLHLERSAAVKCPSVLTQLAGTKKVQQVLATPGAPHLARFLPADARVERLRATFAPMYPLDAGSEAGREGRRLAADAAQARRYVLKPQREGGGNNVYRAAILPHLQAVGERAWPQYVLMEMIEPPVQRNAILRNGAVMAGGVICELGVYGACLWKQPKQGERVGEMLVNEEAGYLLRTKGDTSEEGGVAAGFGAVDSCCLIDV